MKLTRRFGKSQVEKMVNSGQNWQNCEKTCKSEEMRERMLGQKESKMNKMGKSSDKKPKTFLQVGVLLL